MVLPQKLLHLMVTVSLYKFWGVIRKLRTSTFVWNVHRLRISLNRGGGNFLKIFSNFADAPYEILESPSSKKIRGEPLLDEGQISSSYYLKQILSSPNKVEVKRMSREELEDLVLCKVAQVLLHDTEEGKYRMKIMGLEKQRDRLKDRVIALGKQVRFLNSNTFWYIVK